MAAWPRDREALAAGLRPPPGAGLPVLLVTVMLAVLAAGSTAGAQSSFATDPPRGDVRLVVLGDFNGPYGSLDYPGGLARAMAALVQVWRPDLLLSPGDVIAGQDRSLPDERLPAMWAAFDAAVASPLRENGVPYAVAMGNHDASSLMTGGVYTFARDRLAALDYWTAHRPALSFVDQSGYPFDYSFTSSDLFLVMLDASSASVTEAQRRWLAAQLASAPARAAAARIVVGHLPLAPVSQGRDSPGEYVSDGAGLADLLVAGSVDLYVSGHHAAYYPGRWGELELLFAGGIGGRRLLGSDLAPRSTVTVVDVWFGCGDVSSDTTFVYTTFDVASLTVVDQAELPRSVGEIVLSDRALRSVSGPACGDRESRAARPR